MGRGAREFLRNQSQCSPGYPGSGKVRSHPPSLHRCQSIADLRFLFLFASPPIPSPSPSPPPPRIPVLDIDIAGAKSLYAFQERLNSQFVWIDAPSLKDVEARLRGRGTETESQIQRRLETMRQEMALVERHSNLYDARILNDDLEECYARLKKFLKDN